MALEDLTLLASFTESSARLSFFCVVDDDNGGGDDGGGDNGGGDDGGGAITLQDQKIMQENLDKLKSWKTC